MRVPFLVSEFFEWRWAPCVGLTAGSLGFVALALLLIPTRFGGGAPGVERSSSFESPPPQAMYSSALTSNLTETEVARSPEPARARHVAALPSPPSRESGVAVARGFSPVIERPAPPPPPPPAVLMPAAAPPAVPGSGEVNQPVPGVAARVDNP